jgi:hypothetical protein
MRTPGAVAGAPAGDGEDDADRSACSSPTAGATRRTTRCRGQVRVEEQRARGPEEEPSRLEVDRELAPDAGPPPARRGRLAAAVILQACLRPGESRALTDARAPRRSSRCRRPPPSRSARRGCWRSTGASSSWAGLACPWPRRAGSSARIAPITSTSGTSARPDRRPVAHGPADGCGARRADRLRRGRSSGRTGPASRPARSSPRVRPSGSG